MTKLCNYITDVEFLLERRVRLVVLPVVPEHDFVRGGVSGGPARERHVPVAVQVQPHAGRPDARETRAVRQRVQPREQHGRLTALGSVQVERGLRSTRRPHRVRQFRPTVQIGRVSKIEQR